MKRYVLVMVLCLASIGGAWNAAPAAAQTRQRCFPETGFCVSGPILAYWERNGGLPVFGYPISGQQIEQVENWSGPVQWFERDRLEDHSGEGIGVLAGRLGAQTLEAQGRPWQTFPRVNDAAQGCQFFPQTGHSMCEPFLSYWHANGGLARFGYPITEATSALYPDTQSGIRRPYPVQYFERRRMEHHIEYHGTQYEVLLGLLGNNMQRYGGCDPADAPLAKTAAALVGRAGCPTWSFPPMIQNVGAYQPFERGTMVWVRGAYRTPDTIYVIYYDNRRQSLVWKDYTDTWVEGMPEGGNKTAPSGLYEPIRGFGKVWRENPEVRNTLGWAAAPEVATDGTYQLFSSGTVMLHRAPLDRVFILYPDNTADEVGVLR